MLKTKFAVELLELINKDIKNSASILDMQSARVVVDAFYQVQTFRMALASQIRSEKKAGESCKFLEFLLTNMQITENNIKGALTVFVQPHEIYKWLKTVYGIGDIISAGLIAYIDIERCQTAGQIFTYAGLCPGKDRSVKGKKNPFNKDLKVLCWKIGQSFLKFHNDDECYYGKIYSFRKKYEEELNEKLVYKDQADYKLAHFDLRNKEQKECYKKGMLPSAHIERRCQRYATKMFLSHLFTVWYEMVHHEKPPKPYAIAILGHAHEIPIPNWDEERMCVCPGLNLDKLR